MTSETHSTSRNKKSILTFYSDAFHIYPRYFLKYLNVGLVGAIIVYGIPYYLLSTTLPNYFQITSIYSNRTESIIASLFWYFFSTVEYGFYGVIIGMGYDIMNYNRETTELREMSYYFKMYWLRYFIIGAVTSIIFYLVPIIDPERSFISLSIISYVVFFIISMYSFLFSALFPNSRNVNNAITQTNQIWKKQFSIILFGYLLYFIVAWIPTIIIFGFIYHVKSIPEFFGRLSPDLIYFIGLFRLLLAVPIATLVFLRIVFQTFPPPDNIAENKKEE